MNWTYNTHKHYSAEHLHKADKLYFVTEKLSEREKPAKRVKGKRHPRLRR